MKVLVLNCGSSSIKYKLFDTQTKDILAQGGIEKIGLKGSFLKFTLPSGEKVILEKDIPEHTVGIEFILETLSGAKYGCIKSLDEIEAVGHRVVHGGEKSQSKNHRVYRHRSIAQSGKSQRYRCGRKDTTQSTSSSGIRHSIPSNHA